MGGIPHQWQGFMNSVGQTETVLCRACASGLTDAPECSPIIPCSWENERILQQSALDNYVLY